MSRYPRKKLLATAVLGLVTMSSGVANALTLTDGNASFGMDIDGSSGWNGVNSFSVDGTDHFWEQDFLYDITHQDGSQLSGQGFEEMGMIDDGGDFYGVPDSTTLSGTNGVTLTYVRQDVTIDISFLLTGGAAASNDALIVETYQITNTAETKQGTPISQTLNLFAYTDIDLGGTFQGNNGDDEGEILPGTPIPNTSYRQYDPTLDLQMVATTTTSDGVNTPSNWMVGIGEDEFGNTLNTVRNQLYDTTDTYFDNSVQTGPADLQMVAEFVRVLAPGASFSYSHSLQLSNISVSAVPVPAAVWLFGSGLLGLIGVAKRKSA